MRPAQFIVVLTGVITYAVFGLSSSQAQGAEKGPTVGRDGSSAIEIRPASQGVSDRQRDRRRDRSRRRFIRGSGDLLPHFGDYTMHETGFTTARFERAHGMLTIELIDDCGDWTLQEKWNLDFRDHDDRSYRSDVLYRASEVRSADKFVFAYSRQHLGERSDFIGDVLEIEGGYVARFQTPEIQDLYLPADTVFPIIHLRQILSEARRQRTGFESLVFDGGNAIPYRAVTTITQPLRSDDANPRVVAARTELDQKTSDRLPEGRQWPVLVEYFPVDDAYAPPVFTREFLLHENGIVLSFHIDYGDLQMDARLKHLDILEPKPCPN